MTQEQINMIVDWQEKTFGDSDAYAMANHLKKEAEEVGLAIHSGDDAAHVAFEIADCLILLFGIAKKIGLNHKLLTSAIDLKMMVNKQRKWGQVQDNGVVEHIENHTSDAVEHAVKEQMRVFKQFSCDEAVLFDFEIGVVIQHEYGMPKEILMQDKSICTGVDIHKRCFKISLDGYIIAQKFQKMYEQIEKEHQKSEETIFVNYPDIHKNFVDRWVLIMENLNRADMSIIHLDAAEIFTNNVVEAIRFNLKGKKIEGVEIINFPKGGKINSATAIEIGRKVFEAPEDEKVIKKGDTGLQKSRPIYHDFKPGGLVYYQFALVEIVAIINGKVTCILNKYEETKQVEGDVWKPNLTRAMISEFYHERWIDFLRETSEVKEQVNTRDIFTYMVALWNHACANCSDMKFVRLNMHELEGFLQIIITQAKHKIIPDWHLNGIKIFN